MEPNTTLVITLVFTLFVANLSIESVQDIIMNHPIKINLQETFMDNFRYQSVTLSNTGFTDVKNVGIYLDSVGEIGEVISNSCINSHVNFGKWKSDASIMIPSFLNQHSCSIQFKTLADNEIYLGTIVGNGLPEYKWSKSEQELDPIFKLLIVAIIGVIGFASFMFYRIWAKENVSLTGLTPDLLNNSESSFGYKFTDDDEKIIDAIRNENCSASSISKFIDKPRSYVKKRLKLLEIAGVVYVDF